jgi:hypothetical protein
VRSAAGDLALVYLPGPATATVRLDTLRPGGVGAAWIDPQTGAGTSIGRVSGLTASFSSPGGWADALLLLDARNNPLNR